MRFRLLFLLLIPFSLIGHVTHTRHVCDALAYIDGSTLVILDLDNTSIEPVQSLGSYQWMVWYAHQLGGDGAWLEARKRWIVVNEWSCVQTVEPVTCRFVSDLQRRGVRVMACTARPYLAADLTVRQLSQVGLDFRLTAPCPGSFRVGLEGAWPLYQRGVLFGQEGYTKGEILEAFLREINYHPRRIVFLDDQEPNIQSVGAACQRMGIDYVGLHYLGAEERVKAFDPRVAEKQWEMFGKILSDQQARRVAG